MSRYIDARERMRNRLRARLRWLPTRPNSPDDAAGQQEDSIGFKQLEMLHEYTKWHNGIYLSLAGAFGVIASTEQTNWPFKLDTSLIGFAAGLVIVAGIAGGTVASSTVEYASREKFEDAHIAPTFLAYLRDRLGCKPRMRGKHWIFVEHFAFWLSLACAAGALVRGQPAQWYVAKAHHSDGRPVYLCSKQVKPDIAKYWFDGAEPTVTDGPLLWWHAPEAKYIPSKESVPSHRWCTWICSGNKSGPYTACAWPVDPGYRLSTQLRLVR